MKLISIQDSGYLKDHIVCLEIEGVAFCATMTNGKIESLTNRFDSSVPKVRRNSKLAKKVEQFVNEFIKTRDDQ